MIETSCYQCSIPQAAVLLLSICKTPLGQTIHGLRDGHHQHSDSIQIYISSTKVLDDTTEGSELLTGCCV